MCFFFISFVLATVTADSVGNNSALGTVDVTTKILAIMNEVEATFPPLQPAYFVTKNSTVIMAQTGSIARIPCVVKNLGEATVSFKFACCIIYHYSINYLFFLSLSSNL